MNNMNFMGGAGTGAGVNTNQMLQNNLQFGLMNRFLINDPFWDPIIQMLIYTIVAILVCNLSNILNFSWMKYYLDNLKSFISFYYYKYLKKEPEIINKQAVINYITENKKINNMYKAIDWYLSTKCTINYIKETPLKISYEEELESIVDINKLKLNKRIDQNKYKSLKYKDHKIYYILNKNIVSVYTDKERKRENYTITLQTKMRKKSKIDILDDFCKYCIKKWIKNQESSTWVQKIYVNNEKGEWKPENSNNKRKLENVILKNGTTNKLIDDINEFIKSPEWYFERGIPYTMGYLFYGPPGTGKSSMIKGISTHTKRHIHYLMLNNVKNDNQLLQILRNINYNETILVLEDIDCMTEIIKERKKINEKKKNETNNDMSVNEKIERLEKELMNTKHNMINNNMFYGNLSMMNANKEDNSTELTLSGLLNALDGIFNNEGRILIMTTNRPEVLDNALVRPGRIDRKIKFTNCTKKQIEDIYKMMYNIEINEEQKKIINEIEDYKYSPAEITCLLLKYRRFPEESIKNIDKIDKFMEK